MNSRRAKGHSGFSLVEVVLALGIVGFAVVAIVGLLPLALRSARESMEETDATLLARRIHAELTIGTGANRTLSIPGNSTTLVSLTTDGFRAATNLFDQSLVFTSPPEATYAASVVVSTNTGVSNLSQVQIEIASPAGAPVTSRTTNVFTTLLHYTP